MIVVDQPKLNQLVLVLTPPTTALAFTHTTSAGKVMHVHASTISGSVTGGFCFDRYGAAFQLPQ